MDADVDRNELEHDFLAGLLELEFGAEPDPVADGRRREQMVFRSNSGRGSGPLHVGRRVDGRQWPCPLNVEGDRDRQLITTT